MQKTLLFLLLSLMCVPTLAIEPRSVTKEDRKLFDALSAEFQKGVMQADVEKKMTLELLEKTKVSKGQFQLQKGKLRMELAGDENTLLVINSKKLYAVALPPPDKKDMKTNVIEANVGSTQVKNQGLMVLMAKGGFDSMFLVSGVIDSGPNQLTYYLSPKPDTKGLRNAEVKLEKKEKPRLLELTYWDESNNKTSYLFSGHKAVSSLPAKNFEYIIPADANVERER